MPTTRQTRLVTHGCTGECRVNPQVLITINTPGPGVYTVHCSILSLADLDNFYGRFILRKNIFANPTDSQKR